MDIHERRFLTADDRTYLDEIELTLARVYRIPPERVRVTVRALGRELQRVRTGGDQRSPDAQFPYGGAAQHAEILAALLVSPHPRSRFFLGVLASIGAAAGLLGMRVLLALLFRNFTPVRIGWLDILLAIVIVSVILRASRSVWLPAHLGPKNWLWMSVVLGILIGLSATYLLRALRVHGTIFSLPFWLAIAIALTCGGLTWLLTWPGDDPISPTGD